MEAFFGLLIMGCLVALVVGLIAPSVYTKVFKSWATRGRLAMIFLGSSFVLSSLLGMVSPGVPETPAPAVVQEQTTPNTEVKTEETTPVATAPVAEMEQAKPVELFEVVSVTDGDTIKVNINGKTETLRLIGMDTPETVDPRTPVQCFGKEASNKAKETLSGKKVRLESDPTQGELDKYNRLLRYVFLEDGTSYNKMMIEEGFAHEYTYNTPYKYQTEYKEAETRAREGKKGFWGDLCDGNTEQSASSASKAVEPTPTPAPSSSSASQVAPSGGTGWACNCKKTCPSMSCAEAQYQLNSCGCSARDADHDGTACDAQC